MICRSVRLDGRSELSFGVVVRCVCRRRGVTAGLAPSGADVRWAITVLELLPPRERSRLVESERVFD